MTAPNLDAVHRLTASVGLGPTEQLLPLTGGANNRVYRVQAARGVAVLKAYFRHADDPRDRLGAEFAFARFAWRAGVRCIPEPLAADVANGLGLFALVEGGKPSAEDVTDHLVHQAIAFARELNAARWRPHAGLLPIASEACFSIAEHLATVARRVERLLAVTESELAALSAELVPAWQEVLANVERTAADNALSLEKPLDPGSRCVSPSDFGFHNAILGADARVCFLDFEYAGWDDPAKLICDFFYQPAIPVPEQYFESFTRSVAELFPNPELVSLRARLLLPVYRLKWVCIRLNEFLPVGTRRRAFSLSDDIETRQTRQLAAARAALHFRERIAA